MGHGHSHNGKKCHGHGGAHDHDQHQQPREMTYDQIMADPVLRRERLQKQKQGMRGAIQIFAFIACFSFCWFYAGVIDEYLDPPADHHAAVQARLRAAHSTTIDNTFKSGVSYKVFEKTYAGNTWGSRESFSGEGSEMSITESVRKCLGNWIQKYSIDNFGDVCGDTNWQKYIPGISKVDYTGYDVSEKALQYAANKNKDTAFQFKPLDITAQVPDKHDAFMIRDVIQHLTLEQGVSALKNIKDSGAKYLIVSSYPAGRNANIPTGFFYKNNVYEPPFNSLQLAPALEVCDNYDGKHRRMGSKLMLIPLTAHVSERRPEHTNTE